MLCGQTSTRFSGKMDVRFSLPKKGAVAIISDGMGDLLMCEDAIDVEHQHLFSESQWILRQDNGRLYSAFA